MGYLTSSDFTSAEWSDWRWHMHHRISTLQALRNWIDVTPQEEVAITRTASKYRWSITPYYASLMSKADPNCPIRQQAVPHLNELNEHTTASVDPVNVRKLRQTNRVIQKYPDRVILLLTEACPTYCRHCTRKFHTTKHGGTYFESNEGASLIKDIEYIRAHTEIRDVLITGGDPLVYPDTRLRSLLAELRAIDHIDIIRFGTRFPVLLPQRITEEFCSMLAEFHPIWLNTHFNHPGEISPESAVACARLVDHGIPVGNQTVLLKGVNDSSSILRELFRKLLALRVRAYYLYHCDDTLGVSHFRTSIEHGQAIMRELQGYISGLAVPTYVLETEHGKIPLTPSYLTPSSDGSYQAHNYAGVIFNVSPEGTVLP